MGPQDHSIGVDPGQPGRGGVPARGQKPAAEHRVPEHIPDQPEQEDDQEKDVGDAKQAFLPDEGERFGNLVGRAAGDARAQSHEDEHHRQGDDERVDLKPGDEQAVDRAGQDAHGQGQENGQPGRQTPVGQPQAEDDGRDAADGADGQAHLADDQAKGLGQGDKDVKGHLARNHEHGVAAEEALRKKRQGGKKNGHGDDQPQRPPSEAFGAVRGHGRFLRARASARFNSSIVRSPR